MNEKGKLDCPEGHHSEYSMDFAKNLTVVRCLTCGARWEIAMSLTPLGDEIQPILLIDAYRSSGLAIPADKFPLRLAVEHG